MSLERRSAQRIPEGDVPEGDVPEGDEEHVAMSLSNLLLEI
jgi:hypothetical protein